jgi:hypothetical protein
MTAPIPAILSSRRPQGQGTNAAAPAPEVRWICVAQGIQFTNADYRRTLSELGTDSSLSDAERASRRASIERRIMPSGLLPDLPELMLFDWYGRDAGLYFSTVQNVVYVILTISDKAEYLTAIQTPEMIVIYLGGPCFGPDPAPGNDWSDGTDPATRGLFRMGYPVLGVPVHEVLEYGYTPHLLEADAGRPTARDCDPDLRGHHLHARPIAQLHHDPASLEQLARQIGRTVDDPTEFWTYDAYVSGRLERHVVLRAGWEHTTAAPADLGSITPQCRAFLHLGCSTFIHNYPVLRRFKGWTREGDDRFAYWTTAPSIAASLNPLLTRLLTYPHPNAYRPWAPWFRWAVQRTNQDLRGMGLSFRLI